jgi:lipoprotein
MRDQKNDHTLYTVSICASLLSACYLTKNISNKTAITNNPENTALTNKPENTPLPHVEKIIYIEKEEYNKSSDNILKELGNVALLFSIVLLFLLLLYLALYFSKK